jgi:F-type H+-transporting ATPase subunit g
MDRSQWTTVGITTAQLIGFFSVGEMIGRMKIVGYRGSAGHEGH